MLTLRFLRLSRGLTQSEICSHINLSQSYLSQIEAGKYVPAPAVRRRLAKILETDEGTLFSPLEVEIVDRI